MRNSRAASWLGDSIQPQSHVYQRTIARAARPPLVDHRHNPVVDDNVVIWLDRQSLPGLGQYELTCISTESRCCPIEDCYSIHLSGIYHVNHITLPVLIL